LKPQFNPFCHTRETSFTRLTLRTEKNLLAMTVETACQNQKIVQNENLSQDLALGECGPLRWLASCPDLLCVTLEALEMIHLALKISLTNQRGVTKAVI